MSEPPLYYHSYMNGFVFVCIETQFRRCLDQHLGLRISDEDYKFLVDKYDVKENGMVNYRNFSETLEKGGNSHSHAFSAPVYQ